MGELSDRRRGCEPVLALIILNTNPTCTIYHLQIVNFYLVENILGRPTPHKADMSPSTKLGLHQPYINTYQFDSNNVRSYDLILRSNALELIALKSNAS